MMTPAEFHYAIKDVDEYGAWRHQMLCELLRMNAVYVHNTAMGRKKSDVITDPRKLVRFSWENINKPAKTPEQMEGMLRAIALAHGKPKTKKPKGDPNGNE